MRAPTLLLTAQAVVRQGNHQSCLQKKTTKKQKTVFDVRKTCSISTSIRWKFCMQWKKQMCLLTDLMQKQQIFIFWLKFSARKSKCIFWMLPSLPHQLMKAVIFFHWNKLVLTGILMLTKSCESCDWKSLITKKSKVKVFVQDKSIVLYDLGSQIQGKTKPVESFLCKKKANKSFH